MLDSLLNNGRGGVHGRGHQRGDFHHQRHLRISLHNGSGRGGGWNHAGSSVGGTVATSTPTTPTAAAAATSARCELLSGFLQHGLGILSGAHHADQNVVRLRRLVQQQRRVETQPAIQLLLLGRHRHCNELRVCTSAGGCCGGILVNLRSSVVVGGDGGRWRADGRNGGLCPTTTATAAAAATIAIAGLSR